MLQHPYNATITGDLNLQYYWDNNLETCEQKAIFTATEVKVWQTLWWLQLDQSYGVTKHKDPSFYNLQQRTMTTPFSSSSPGLFTSDEQSSASVVSSGNSQVETSTSVSVKIYSSEGEHFTLLHAYILH
jgi:hypothetical protein